MSELGNTMRNGSVRIPGGLIKVAPWIIAFLMGGWMVVKEFTTLGMAQYRTLPEKVACIEREDVKQDEEISTLKNVTGDINRKLDRILERLPARRN